MAWVRVCGRWLSVASLALLAACAALPPAAPTPPTPPASGATAVVKPTDEPGSRQTPLPVSLPASIAAALRGDLAQRLSVAAEEVTIKSAERLEMPAGGLGCGPEAGAQNQGLIMGTEVVAEALGQEYVYRTDGRRLVPCSPDFPGGTRPTYMSGVADPTPDSDPRARAVADLAARLGIAAAEIVVLRFEAVDWPDASLGCARPGAMYAQVITPGQRVLLEAAGRTYDYHFGGGRMLLCGQ